MVRSKNYLKTKKILVVCHDAGGADVISSWIFVNKLKNFNYYIKGPSIKIFKDKLKKIKVLNKIKLSSYDLIITGTSLINNLELKIIKKAKRLKIPTYTFLDHWVNYKKRFLRDGKLVLPNQIIVLDKYAQVLAKKKFKNLKINLINDCRKTFFKKKYKINNIKEMKNTFLYFSSNYNLINKNRDENILKKFIKFLKISKFKNYKIYIKTHPSEFQNKYVRFFDNKTIFKDKSKNIIESISKYSSFFGSDSMALVYAKYANKKVYNIKIKKKNDIPNTFFLIIK